VDPQYRSPAKGDFRLQPGSPALGAGLALPNFAESQSGANPDMGAFPAEAERPLPYRPIPIFLDAYELRFAYQQEKSVEPQRLNASVKGAGAAPIPFSIQKNAPFDWFTVEPSIGTLSAAKPVAFRVSLVPEKMTAGGPYRGVFLIRLTNGFSRPVTVYVRQPSTVPLKGQGSAYAQYFEAEKPAGEQPLKVIADPSASGGQGLFFDGETPERRVAYDFDIPRGGRYYLFIRYKPIEILGEYGAGSLQFSLDGAEPRPLWLLASGEEGWNWSCLSAFSWFDNRSRPFQLEAGRHRLVLAPRKGFSISIDTLMVTDNDRWVSR
jgi:hypothetical protein